MSQFSLKLDPSAIDKSFLNDLIDRFNKLSGAKDYLNIKTIDGNSLYITDNSKSPLITPGNQTRVGSLADYRGYEQALSKNKLILLNPNQPDDKPILNVLIHEIAHFKYPGLGNDATQHEPLFYALLQ